MATDTRNWTLPWVRQPSRAHPGRSLSSAGTARCPPLIRNAFGPSQSRKTTSAGWTWCTESCLKDTAGILIGSLGWGCDVPKPFLCIVSTPYWIQKSWGLSALRRKAGSCGGGGWGWGYGTVSEYVLGIVRRKADPHHPPHPTPTPSTTTTTARGGCGGGWRWGG